MNFLKIYFIVFAVTLIFISGCSDNSNNPIEETATLLYEKPGLVDSLVGTCSAYLIRTSIFDSIDTRSYDKLKIEFNAYTDGDLSNISFYYLNADTNSYLITLDGSNKINNSKSFSIASPQVKNNFFLRLKLFASVCTEQNYHLKIKNLKIYGVN